MTPNLSRHAGIRLMQRGFTREDICAALVGVCLTLPDGTQHWRDTHTSCTVVIAPDGTVVTVQRTRKRRIKQWWSR